MTGDFGGAGEVAFSRRGCAGVITLQRPAALNALTHGMVLAIARALDAWEADDGIAVVLIRGEGRAFCAGGDIQAIYRAGQAGKPLYRFFADEYRLNTRIEAYPKPYIALIDGIVMGGGVGVSIHGSHRVFTENARFAMPEVTIGFFPDVGGSHFLPCLPGEAGMWLGLTGTRLGQGDALQVGVATHAVEAGGLDELAAALSSGDDVGTTLARFSAMPERQVDDKTLASVADIFAAATLGDLVARLRARAGAADTFARAVLERLNTCSPTSLGVAFRQIRAGRALSMRECMAMEYRIVSRMLRGYDFYEGIRAAVIDKDGVPRWRPDTLQAVDPASIDEYFAPLGEHELDFDPGGTT